MKNVRQVTKSVNPKSHAVWTLESLAAALCTYCYEIYDAQSHSTLLQSPRAAYAQALERSGNRDYMRIPYDDAFKMLTMPSVASGTPRGTAKVQPNRGVMVKGDYFWCDSFKDPKVIGTRVEVRYDPFDAGLAYAHVHSRWQSILRQLRREGLTLSTRNFSERMKHPGQVRNETAQHVIKEFRAATAQAAVSSLNHLYR